MPLSHGLEGSLDTNKEMLVDFNALSRDIFATAYELGSEREGFIDALEGKPIGALYLKIVASLPGESSYDSVVGPDAVRQQSITIRPLHTRDKSRIYGMHSMDRATRDVHEVYDALAHRLGGVLMQRALDVDAVLPPEGVIAQYYATRTDAPRTLGVKTLESKSKKDNLILAKTFAAESLEYVRSSAYAYNTKGVTYQYEDVFAPRGAIFSHEFMLSVDIDIPLNGHEPKPYILTYKQTMEQKQQEILAHIERLASTGHGNGVLRQRMRVADKYARAIERANELLDEDMSSETNLED